jgi:hypothetical protein
MKQQHRQHLINKDYLAPEDGKPIERTTCSGLLMQKAIYHQSMALLPQKRMKRNQEKLT